MDIFYSSAVIKNPANLGVLDTKAYKIGLIIDYYVSYIIECSYRDPRAALGVGSIARNNYHHHHQFTRQPASFGGSIQAGESINCTCFYLDDWLSF